mgnify:CR=1 FL=1
MNRHFKKVFLITGNHEYYGNHIDKVDDYIRHLVRNLGNVVFLQNEAYEWNGIVWIGSTLWTAVKENTPRRVLLQYNDFGMIRGMTLECYNALHKKAVVFLESTIKKQKSPVVVITHHLPLKELVLPEYQKEEYKAMAQYYSSDCSLVVGERVVLWVYGHTHKGSVQEWRGVSFVCAPLGYRGETPEESVEYSKTVLVKEKSQSNR